MCLAFVGIFLAKKAAPVIKSQSQQNTSDAKDLKGRMKLALDDWVGYYPLDSNRMRKFMRNEGYILDVVNDGADYPARMKKLAAGELDFAVVTVDSYILNAVPVDFPGTIIAILDESKGGDAIVGDANQGVSSLESFKDPKIFSRSPDHPLKIAYTASSPSEHLLKSVISHFDVPVLKALPKEQRIETQSSEEALKLFRDKKVPVAILWEPNVSKALEIPGAVKILGTESTSRLIVDILVVNRDFARKNPEQVDLLLKIYFRTLKFYADNPEDLKKDMSTELKLSKDSVQKMLDGVAWVNLSENCQEWFGFSGPGQIAQQGLVDTIESTVSILVESGDFKDDPLPDKDPYRIINSSFIQHIYETGIKNGFAGMDGSAVGAAMNAMGLDRPFKPLTDQQWDKLRPVGSIKVEPIMFQTGSADLDVTEKEKLDVMINNRLKHYPMFRVLVGGHTSYSGDPEANMALSQQRADAVARYLFITYSIDQNRIKAVGYGGTKPLSKLADESERGYQYRLPRVEISLLAESF